MRCPHPQESIQERIRDSAVPAGRGLDPLPPPLKREGSQNARPKATAVAAGPLPSQERWQGERVCARPQGWEGYERLPNEQRKHHQATAHVRRNNTSSRFGMRREAPLLARFLAMSVIPA